MIACRQLMLVPLVVGLVGGCTKQTPPSTEAPPNAPSPSPAPADDATAPASQARENEAGREGTATRTSHPGAMPTPHARAMPDPHATIAGGTEAEKPQPTESKLDGITLKIPQGWVYEVPQVNPRMPEMTPQAVFRLAAVEGDSENVYVRVTHFPRMKTVRDEMNLQRWYSMFEQPDGTPTKDASTVERFEVAGVKILLADIPGTMKAPGAFKRQWRMLGAIIKDEQGPHFVKVVGPANGVAHWKDSVRAYLESVQVD